MLFLATITQHFPRLGKEDIGKINNSNTVTHSTATQVSLRINSVLSLP